ncbi:MAG TPA: CDP-diacylglycerol--serine O-phosphatidyltransferase, partial [Woeseiaceae bacterium]|nr:CDP-diacylglycerol--serine O-phosphatidyltransferase [Woeseiaceae bacterium]
MKKIVRYSIPNIFTAASLILGFAAIITSQHGNIEQAAWMIVWCGILDVMDGLAARLLNATSPFGAEFDSMADLISFGVAPAIIMLNAVLHINGLDQYSNEFWILSLSVSAFVLAGALRLARYNITNDKPIKGWFSGLPITGAGAGLTATAVILLMRYQTELDANLINLLVPIFMVVLTVCMVSTFKFPKMMKRDGFYINTFQAINFTASCYCAVTRSYPEFLFCMGIFLLV